MWLFIDPRPPLECHVLFWMASKTHIEIAWKINSWSNLFAKVNNSPKIENLSEALIKWVFFVQISLLKLVAARNLHIHCIYTCISSHLVFDVKNTLILSQRYTSWGNMLDICPLETVCNLKLRVGHFLWLKLFKTNFMNS